MKRALLIVANVVACAAVVAVSVYAFSTPEAPRLVSQGAIAR